MQVQKQNIIFFAYALTVSIYLNTEYNVVSCDYVKKIKNFFLQYTRLQTNFKEEKLFKIKSSYVFFNKIQLSAFPPAK